MVEMLYLDPWMRRRAFQRGCGEWAPLDPPVVFDLLAGLPVWVVGGWAIEAFTGPGASTRTSTSRSSDADVTALAGPS